jgi:tetratricopeptide (TPR) repeat protein
MPAVKYLQVLSLTIAGLLVGLDTNLLWAQRSAADNHVAYYQQLFKRNPQNAKAYLGLGDAFIRKARETGDTSYFNRAEAALKRSLELAPENSGALRHLAYVFYSRHEFAPAVVFARKAVEMNSSDRDSYGVLGDALRAPIRGAVSRRRPVDDALAADYLVGVYFARRHRSDVASAAKRRFVQDLT